MENHKVYIDTEKKNVKIKFSISYTKEQNNWATNQSIAPGYRVNARPVEIEDREDYRVESFGAFTGFGDTLIPCTRRSKKRYEAAIKELENRMVKYIDWFNDRGHRVTEEARKECIRIIDLKR